MAKTIQASLSGQTLTLTGAEGIFSDSEKYLSLSFTLPEEYSGCTASFLFRRGGDCRTVGYTGESVFVPWEIIRPPCFFVSLLITDGDGLKVTTCAARVEVGMSGYEEGVLPADPTPDIYTEILNRLKAQSSSPYIGDNGHWYVFDNETGEYADSGVSASSGGSAAGGSGADGRGIASITRTSGTGAAGSTDIYTIIYTDGTRSTFSVRNGSDGANGVSPHIGENGHWYIGGTDTNVLAVGQDGVNGSNGTDGIGAYEAAVAGGYTGTASTFNADLAAMSALAAGLEALL